MNNLKLRMYFFVPYNISEIQKGIQAGHAAMEYAYQYGHTKLFKDFMENHRTWIILNGGTTRDYGSPMDIDAGTLNQIGHTLSENKINFAQFAEPDLNFALTAICFICDERVFDFEIYPDFNMELILNGNGHEYKNWLKMIGGSQNATMRDIIKGKRLA